MPSTPGQMSGETVVIVRTPGGTDGKTTTRRNDTA
jgi:hypothetical protein